MVRNLKTSRFLLLFTLALAIGLASCNGRGAEDKATETVLAESSNSITISQDEYIELKVAAKTAELEARTAAAEAKVEAYDNLIDKGWGPCCGCQEKPKVIYTGGGGGNRNDNRNQNDTRATTNNPDLNWLGWLLAWDRNGATKGNPNVVTGDSLTTAGDSLTTAQVQKTVQKQQPQPEPRNIKGDLGLLTIPSKELGFANVGIQYPVGDRWTLRGGLMTGYQRNPQTHEVLPGDAVDVKTGNRILVGPYVGASYQVLNKVNIDGLANVWGIGADKGSLFLGLSAEVLPDLNVGGGYNFGTSENSGVGIHVRANH